MSKIVYGYFVMMGTRVIGEVPAEVLSEKQVAINGCTYNLVKWMPADMSGKTEYTFVKINDGKTEFVTVERSGLFE